MRGSHFKPYPIRLLALTLIGLAATALVFAALSCSSKSSEPAASAPSSSTPAATAPAPAESTSGAANASNGPVDGATIFAQRCALCHGPTGHGDGIGGKALKPSPRNFHDTAYMKTRSDSDLLKVIHEGKGPMPKWGGILTDEQIKAVLGYVRKFAGTP